MTNVLVNNMGSTALFDYTPVETDADKYLRIVAMYRDEYYNTTLKTVMVVSENAVLAQAATNGAPTFTDGASATRSVAEDLAGKGNIGSPVSATDDDNDTLTYMLASSPASSTSTPVPDRFFWRLTAHWTTRPRTPTRSGFRSVTARTRTATPTLPGLPTLT